MIGSLAAPPAENSLAVLIFVVHSISIIKEGQQKVQALSIFSRHAGYFKQAYELGEEGGATIRAWLEGSHGG